MVGLCVCSYGVLCWVGLVQSHEVGWGKLWPVDIKLHRLQNGWGSNVGNSDAQWAVQQMLYPTLYYLLSTMKSTSSDSRTAPAGEMGCSVHILLQPHALCVPARLLKATKNRGCWLNPDLQLSLRFSHLVWFMGCHLVGVDCFAAAPKRSTDIWQGLPTNRHGVNVLVDKWNSILHEGKCFQDMEGKAIELTTQQFIRALSFAVVGIRINKHTHSMKIHPSWDLLPG